MTSYVLLVLAATAIVLSFHYDKRNFATSSTLPDFCILLFTFAFCLALYAVAFFFAPAFTVPRLSFLGEVAFAFSEPIAGNASRHALPGCIYDPLLIRVLRE